MLEERLMDICAGGLTDKPMQMKNNAQHDVDLGFDNTEVTSCNMYSNRVTRGGIAEGPQGREAAMSAKPSKYHLNCIDCA